MEEMRLDLKREQENKHAGLMCSAVVTSWARSFQAMRIKYHIVCCYVNHAPIKLYFFKNKGFYDLDMKCPLPERLWDKSVILSGWCY